LLVIVASIGELSGGFRYFRGSRRRSAEEPLPVRTWATRVLLSGGTLLILTGFIHGAFYAVVDLQKHEAQDQAALETMISASVAQQTLAARNMKDAHLVVEGYGLLQAEKAVNIAAHSHIIEFGLLSMLLAFLQAYVVLSEPVRRAIVTLMLTGSFVLPVFVLLEIKLGVIAAGMADFGGLLVIVALIGMALGALRGGNQVPDSVHGARV